MKKLLIVDDEENIREIIYKYAIREGYEVDQAENGKVAIDLCKKNNYDLIVMDVMMPEVNGFDAYKTIKTFKEIPCIFLTALNEEYNKIYGFDLGSDDYVTKPFSTKELMMRIKVILKRTETKEVKDVFKIKGLTIDENSRLVYVDKEKVTMTNKEFELLVYLVKNKGNVISRQDIIRDVWGYQYYSDDRTLDTHIKLLRKDLKEYGEYITTLRGVGYRFESEKTK